MKSMLWGAILILIHPLQADFFRRVEEFATTSPYTGITQGYDVDDTDLISRIISSYQLAKKEHLGNSMWQSFFDQRHRGIHDVFMYGDFDSCANILRNPKDSDLFFGFDALSITSLSSRTKDYETLVNIGHSNLDLLVRLGEAISAIRLEYPEATANKNSPKRTWYSADVLDQIKKKIRFGGFFP